MPKKQKTKNKANFSDINIGCGFLPFDGRGGKFDHYLNVAFAVLCLALAAIAVAIPIYFTFWGK